MLPSVTAKSHNGGERRLWQKIKEVVVTPTDKVYAWLWFGWGFVLFQQDCPSLRYDCVKHAEKTPRRLLVLDDLALFSPDFEEGLPAFVLKLGCLGCAYGSNFLRVTQATVKAKPKMSGRFRNSKMFAAHSGLASS